MILEIDATKMIYSPGTIRIKPSELTFIIRDHLSEHWGSLDDKDGDVPP